MGCCGSFSLIIVLLFCILNTQFTRGLDSENSTLANATEKLPAGKSGNDSSPASPDSTADNNSTSNDGIKFKTANPMLKADALKRASYVILGFTGIIILYLVVKAIRLRGNTKARRYKVLSRKGDTEMEPLDQSDEEEESTIFDATSQFTTNNK